MRLFTWFSPPPSALRPLSLFLLLALVSLAQAEGPATRPLLPIPKARPIPGARADLANPGAPASQPVKPAFIIGVWSQPADSVPKWKARGINTMFNYESQGNTVSMDDYSGACAFNGMFMVRQPNVPKLQEDVAEPYLLAWMHDDEPDIKNPPTDPALLQDVYKRMKAADPKRPVFVNFSGGNILFKKTPRSFYDGYIKAADWVGNDFYPVTGWSHPEWIFRTGEICDILKEWSANKPQIVCIECSDQKLAWTPKGTRGVTPDEMTAEIWECVVHGAKGIMYFPQDFGGGFRYDAVTDTPVGLEMARQNGRLTDLGPVISLPANPNSATVTVHDPLEAGWRRTSDGTLYLIVINHSSDLQRHQPINFTGSAGKNAKDYWGENRMLPIVNNGFTDDFHPLEVKVYAISKKG